MADLLIDVIFFNSFEQRYYIYVGKILEGKPHIQKKMIFF